MQSPPWKEAASLIIVSRAADKTGRNSGRLTPTSTPNSPSSAFASSVDYRIMMVKRSGLSSFMASAFVFPGGKVEVADYSPRWWHVFANCGTPKSDLDAFSTGILGPRPPMVSNPLTILEAKRDSTDEPDYLSSDIALRISAIRETFEETGVLLLTHPSSTRSSSESLLSQHSTPLVPYSELNDVNVDLVSWRERVRTDPNAFLELCLETGLAPDVWSLYEWSDWLTPISVGHKRFDAMFYICCLESQPKVVLDNAEVTTLQWCTPIDMLEEHFQEKVFLAPPQVYELSRIHNLPNFNAVHEFARKRQILGVERWLPVISTYNDGALSVLPGDDSYPSEPDLIGKKPIPDFPQSLDEMRAQTKRINRLELRGPTCMAFCNVKLNCGHMSPFSYTSIPTAQLPTARQEQQRNKILEDLQKKQQLLKQSQSATNAVTTQSPLVSAKVSPNESPLSSSSTSTATPTTGGASLSSSQRAALQHAHNNSFGYFITQDSSFGNLILPVLPRFD